MYKHTLHQPSRRIKQTPSQLKSVVAWKYCKFSPSKTHRSPPLRALKQHHSTSLFQERQVTTTNCLCHLLALQSCSDTAALKSRPSPGFPCSGHANTPPAISGLNRFFSVTQYIHSTLGFQSKKKAKYCGRLRLYFKIWKGHIYNLETWKKSYMQYY